jgi:hypothetical protein
MPCGLHVAHRGEFLRILRASSHHNATAARRNFDGGRILPTDHDGCSPALYNTGAWVCATGLNILILYCAAIASDHAATWLHDNQVYFSSVGRFVRHKLLAVLTVCSKFILRTPTADARTTAPATCAFTDRCSFFWWWHWLYQ